MGRRPYMIQLALGRSAFEPLPGPPDANAAGDVTNHSEIQNPVTQGGPGARDSYTELRNDPARQLPPGSAPLERPVYQQQYDSRGQPEYPASRELARQSRRAMNDVLATAGVCVGPNSDSHKLSLGDRSRSSLDKAKIHNIGVENSIGLIMDSMEMLLSLVANLATYGLRHRLQTFRFYSGVPMVQIFKRERKQYGLLKMFFSGIPATCLYQITAVAQEWVVQSLVLSIEDYRFIDTISFALLLPLDMFSILQGLDLLPSWPLFPHPRSLIPFSTSSPLQLPNLPDPFTLSSFTGSLASLAFSPLFLWWALLTTKPAVARKMRTYIRAAIPKPYSPDRCSIEAAKNGDLDEDDVPGLRNAPDRDPAEWESSSFSKELAKDLQCLGRNFQILYDRLAHFLANSPPSSLTKVVNIPPTRRRNAISINPPQGTTAGPLASPSLFSPSSTISSIFSSRPDTPRPPIEITTTATGSRTVHIDIQVPFPSSHPEPFPDAPITQPENEAETQSKEDPNRGNLPLYRVSVLTVWAADSMAQRLSLRLTDLLFLPLEALFVRRLALSFLSAPRANPQSQAAAASLRGEVFPPGGWFGMGLRGGGVLDYAGKMVMMVGMEMGLNYVVWQACTGFAWVCGRRWFGWGKL